MIKIVFRSLRQHALSSTVTAATVALACGLAMAVFSIQRQAYHAFTFAGGNVGFDAVLGARGSDLQLVLNSVFHLETSPGNIPWKFYTDLQHDPRVALAIPYAVGDNYKGFRIVGTTRALFDKLEYAPGRKYTLRPPGNIFDDERMEAVIGSYVAEKTGLTVGAEFHPSHGLLHDQPGEHEHEEEYVVVGVLEPTNTPADRVIWIPIEGVFRMGGHALHGGGETYVAHPGETIPDDRKEVSVVMLKLRTPEAGMTLSDRYNQQGKEATFAWPISTVMADFFNKIGWVNRVLELVAYLVVVASAGTILAGIYNTMNERRREFAILRALGARRATVFGVIVLESATIAALGAVLGFVAYGGILFAARTVIHGQTGVVLELFAWHPAIVLMPVAMIAVGALVGIVPAIKAYATDVAGNLAAET